MNHHSFLFFLWGPHPVILSAQVTPGRLWGAIIPYDQGIKPGSATCKANSLRAMFSLLFSTNPTYSYHLYLSRLLNNWDYPNIHFWGVWVLLMVNFQIVAVILSHKIGQGRNNRYLGALSDYSDNCQWIVRLMHSSDYM